MFNSHWIRALVLIIAVVGLLGVPRKSGAAPTTLAVGIYCISLGHQRLECHADVGGGTGSYTYNWTPTPTPAGSGQDLVIIPCARANRNQTVSLTVTDSSGASDTASTTTFCGNAD